MTWDKHRLENRSICVLYGVNEGPAMGRKFVAACRQAGLEPTSDPAAADIIFAHSGGCFVIPPKNHARLIVLVGLSYWPGKPLVVATAAKTWRDYQYHRQQHTTAYWLRKLGYHVRYALDLRRTINMARNWSADSPWNSSQRQVVIRNRSDAYCTPDILDLPFKGPRTFISLPGEHDDCWDNPGPYINLLQSFLQEHSYERAKSTAKTHRQV